MEKNVRISILLQIYGKMLTNKQNQALEDYYNNDLSLAEISENIGITRQAVRDNIKQGEKNLFELEEKLGFMKKIEKLKKDIGKLNLNNKELDKIIEKL